MFISYSELEQHNSREPPVQLSKRANKVNEPSLLYLIFTIRHTSVQSEGKKPDTMLGIELTITLLA